MKIIKNHVTNFKDNEEEYKFLSNFKKGQNKDLYKYFFNKDSLLKNHIFLFLK